MGEENFFPLGGFRAMTNNEGQVEILLVEDSALDARVIQESFKKIEVPNRVHVVGNGERALAFLHRGVEFADAPRPDLILLDLLLPEVSGLEVLSAIKQTKHLRAIPVIVLTRSEEDSDAFQAYDLQANCYLNKPHNIEGFIEIARTIAKLWLRHIPVPRPGGDNQIATASQTESAAPPGSDSD
jgi:chemotaxis family two-component system response regulator Rcp1